MGIKKKDIEREYRKFFVGWFPKVLERGTLIQLNVKDKTDIKEDDLEVLKFFYKSYHNGELSQFMPEVGSPEEEEKETEIPQTDLFTDNTAEGSNDVTVYPDVIEFGIGIDDKPVETKKEKKK